MTAHRLFARRRAAQGVSEVTRKELFEAFPRPWRVSGKGHSRQIMSAENVHIAPIEPGCELEGYSDALAQLLVDLVNGAEE